MLPEMLEPAVCVKKTTLQHFSSLTSLTSFPNTHGVLSKCRVVISKSLAQLRKIMLFCFRSFCEEGSCRGILNLSYVVTLNWKGVCFKIPTANTIKHVCLQRELSLTLCVSWKRNTARSEGVRNDGYEEREEEEDRRLLWNVCGSSQNSTISFVRA